MDKRKKISVTIPCYNDEKCVPVMVERVTRVFREQLPQYDYEVIFVDDCSPDRTRDVIREQCAKDRHIKGVFNARNFGYTRNVFATLQYGTGDATFLMFSDLQDPPELLPRFAEAWEAGHKVVIGQKTRSKESKLMFFLRTVYYNVIGKLSDTRQIQHFNSFGLYDRAFVDVMRRIDDPWPYLKGLVSEYAMSLKVIGYEQDASLRGKSGFNFWKTYDNAMVGITSYTKILMRLATFAGAALGVFSALLAVFVLVSKLLHWNVYPYGTATIIIGVFFIGAVQLFFMGIMGEYVLSINTRTMRRPLVVVEERIGFDEAAEAGEKEKK